MRLKYIIAAVLALVGVILGIYNWVNYFKTQAQLPKPAIQAVRPPPKESQTQQEKQKTQAGVRSNRNIRVSGTLAAGSKILLQLPDTVGRNPFLTPEEIEAIEALGVKIHTGKALGRDFSLPGVKESGFDAVLIGTGAHTTRSLGIPGEDTPGVMDALEFLARVNLGRAERLPRHVAVVGGGNTALDAARCALRLGADVVYLVYRRTRAEMPAHEREIADAEAEGNKEAAILFKNIAGVEAGHRDRYMKLLEMVENGTVYKRDKPIRWICSKCGHIHEGIQPPGKCPVCRHPREYFEPECMEF